jgi:hypothetical protein
VIPALVGAAVLLAAFIKGAIGFGFPSLATPLLSLGVDVKTAVVVLILPNIVMDGIQFVRRGASLGTVRRFAPLLLSGAVGIVLGTRVLTLLSPRAATLALGAFVLAFVTLSATGVTPRVPARWERWLSPPAGFITGVIGGVTNSVAFLFYKLVQLGAVIWFGLLPWSLVGPSLVLTAVALAGFALGLRVQDRLDQRTFNRAVLGFLAALGAWLLIRSLR